MSTPGRREGGDGSPGDEGAGAPSSAPTEVAADAWRLLAWYERHARALPWRPRDRRESTDSGSAERGPAERGPAERGPAERGPADPYRTLLSELMLQQTRVEVVVPHFLRFLERFPDLGTLAAADEDAVLAAWSGLGYYRRARALHTAARAIAVAGWPRTAAGLAALPGVGAYTAAAVASIAFGETIPAIDGNLRRVVGRYLGLESLRGAQAERRLRAAARQLLVDGRAGEGNQALMDVGAMVCRPARPACLLCPLARGCKTARHGGTVRPAAGVRRPSLRIEGTLVLVRRGSSVLLARRPPGAGPLAGSWEPPWVPTREDAASALAARYGGRWTLGDELGIVRHAVTHHAFVLRLCRGELLAAAEIAEGRAAELRFVAPGEESLLQRSSLVDKAVRTEAAAERDRRE